MNIKAQKISEYLSRVVIILIVAVFSYPVIFVTLTSFKSNKEFYTNIFLFPKKLVTSNYYDAIVSSHIGDYFLNSVIVVLISVVMILILGALAGYALARLNIPGSNIILLLFLLCTFVPSESTLMPAYLMSTKLFTSGSYQSLIVPYIAWGLPMTIFIYYGFFKTLPMELIESARIDGCGEIRIFISIVAPLMLPATATNFILQFVGWWGELLWATVSLSTTSMKTLPLGLVTFMSTSGTDWARLSAAVCFTLLPIIVLFLFMQKYFIQGLTGGAVKG